MTLAELEAYHEALLADYRDDPDYDAQLMPFQLEIEKKKLIGVPGEVEAEHRESAWFKIAIDGKGSPSPALL